MSLNKYHLATLLLLLFALPLIVLAKTWTSSDFEGGTISNPVALPINDDNDTWWSDSYVDLADMDFNPASTTVDEIRVIVGFTASTTDGTAGTDNGPRAQGCFAGNVSGAGTYYCSNFVNDLSGASNQTFTISSSSLRTYVVSGEGAAGTIADWNSLVSAMTQNDNDVLVHSWTEGDGNLATEGGDKIVFDTVTVEVDYTIGDPAKLVFLTSSQTITAGATSTAITVQTQNASSTPAEVASATTIALTSTSGAGTFYINNSTSTAITSVDIANGTSSATFFYRDTVAGTSTITSAESPSEGWTDATQAETIIPDSATKLGFTTQPSITEANQSISPAPTVAIQDQFGNSSTTATNVVEISIGTNPSSGSLSGTTSTSATSGTSSFGDLSIDNAGDGYTFVASSTGLSSSTSNSFNITAIGSGSSGSGSGSGRSRPCPSTQPVSIMINSGATSTASREVVLLLMYGDYSPYNTRVQLSERADLLDAVESTADATKVFVLSDGYGEKTVYARLLDYCNRFSDVVADSIEYERAFMSSPPPQLPPQLPQTPICLLPKTIPGSLSVGSRGDEVTVLQIFLKCRGDFPSDIIATGYYGPITEESVRHFQLEQEIEETGIVDQFTRDELLNFVDQEEFHCNDGAFLSEHMGIGSTGESVEMLQRYLASDPDLYPEGFVTGYFGDLTRGAVVRFQERHRVEILAPLELSSGTGYFGSLTLSQLNSILCEPEPETAKALSEEDKSQELQEQPEEKDTSEQKQKVIINSHFLNVRASHTPRSEIIDVVSENETYYVIEDKYEWLSIERSDDRTGWIYGEYTKATEATEATEQLNL